MTPVRYAADPAEFRRTLLLDGLTLIFHRPSGSTHVVASPAPEILDLLSGEPASLADLLGRLTAAFELGDADEAEAALAARLAELEAAGLVRRS